MADEKEATKAPIIIKKIKKGGHGGHHGGSWKVAYADFVTAMMAFFLLMWLLNATSEEQKRGITTYFSPTGTAVGGSGAGGILGGMSAFINGSLSSMTNPPPSVGPLVGTTSTPDSEVPFDKVPEQDFDSSAPKPKEVETENQEAQKPGTKEEQQTFPDTTAQDQDVQKTPPKGAKAGTDADDQVTNEEAVEKIRQEEQKRFKATKQKIQQTLQGSPDLKGLEKHLKIDETPEGLRIQIVDEDDFAMFPSAGRTMYPHAQQLLGKVAEVIQHLPNSISITGHTDANPYSGKNGDTNWELSSNRANASRRVLLGAGYPPDKIGVITGRASADPLVKEDPYSPRNRRISIVLLRQAPLIPQQAKPAAPPMIVEPSPTVPPPGL